MLAAVCAWGENCIKMCAWKPARNVDLLFLLFFLIFMVWMCHIMTKRSNKSFFFADIPCAVFLVTAYDEN